MQVYEQLQDMRKDPKFCKYLKKGTKTEIPYPYRHTRSAYGRLIGKASKGGKAAKLLNAIGPILWGIQIGKGVAGGCDDELGNAKKELGCFAGNPTQLQCQAAMSSRATYAECLGMEEAISGLALHKAILEVCTKFK